MAIEIVDLPIKNGDFPWLCLFTRGYGFLSFTLAVWLSPQTVHVPVFRHDIDWNWEATGSEIGLSGDCGGTIVDTLIPSSSLYNDI